MTTKVSEQTSVNKSEVFGATRKIAEFHYSIMFKLQQMLFYEKDGINSSNWDNIQTHCKLISISKYSRSRIIKTVLKDSSD